MQYEGTGAFLAAGLAVSAVVIGAPVGGLAADAIGFRSPLWVSAVGLAVAALVLGASPFRRA